MLPPREKSRTTSAKLSVTRTSARGARNRRGKKRTEKEWRKTGRRKNEGRRENEERRKIGRRKRGRRKNEESEEKKSVRRGIMKIEESETSEAINIMKEATRRTTIIEGAGTIAREIAIVTVLRVICLAIVPLTAIMSIATARKAMAGPGYRIGRVSLTNLI